jgi:hypothetical protein
MRDLLVIVPTRGRSANFRRLVEAIRQTASGDPQVLACLDTDDAHNYEPIEGVWYLIKERQRFVAWTNEAARLYAHDFRFLGAVGDDFVPRTVGWDAAVAETLTRFGTGLCYGNDLLQGENLPTACFMTSDIVETLGYMNPPSLIHMYPDNFWLELGRALGRIEYLPEVILEHLHPSKGKSPSDPVYEESDSLMERDRLAFVRYMHEGFDADVAKIRRMLAQSARRSSSGTANGSAPYVAGTGNPKAAEIPILITCHNRVEPLRHLVSWLESAGYERIAFVDNASTYEPLLSYYENTPHQVLRLGKNVGHLAVWEARVLETIGHSGPYVVTDCDVVPDHEAPADALDYFAELLFRYGDVDKVGFGLHIDDLPETYQFRGDVIDWESRFWADEVEQGVYRADIDTTFALYRPTARNASYRALRTGSPYLARHLPWYKDSKTVSDEDRYYRDHATPDMSNWDRAQLPESLQDKLDAHRAGRATLPSASTTVQGQDNGVAAVAPTLTESEPFEVVALTIPEIAAERAAREAAERELAAVRQTRSYRWLEPARRLRALSRGKRG